VFSERLYGVPPAHFLDEQINTNLTALILTCLLNPWSRVVLEKLTGSQLVTKFPESSFPH
jgi:hypothetical protein